MSYGKKMYNGKCQECNKQFDKYYDEIDLIYFKEKKLCHDCLNKDYTPHYHVSTHSTLEAFETCGHKTIMRNYQRITAKPSYAANIRRVQ